MRFTLSTNYNQFLPSPDLNYSRYGIVHSERLGYQLWQRPLEMVSTVYETEISFPARELPFLNNLILEEWYHADAEGNALPLLPATLKYL